MARFTLDTSSLLGFDQDGDALWDVADARSDGTGAHGVAKAAGMEKDDNYPFPDNPFGDFNPSDPVTTATVPADYPSFDDLFNDETE